MNKPTPLPTKEEEDHPSTLIKVITSIAYIILICVIVVTAIEFTQVGLRISEGQDAFEGSLIVEAINWLKGLIP